MQVWSVGFAENALHKSGLKKFSALTVRYFNNGIELITALRENTLGRLSIFLNIQLPIIDGLGIIRLLHQEGLIDQHEFILSAPTLSEADMQLLKTWQVEIVGGE